MLKGKTAIVTGSGRGIGRAIALALAQQGANLVVNDVNMENAQKVVGEIEATGRTAITVQADVTEESQVNAMMASCIDRFGRIDILVNNAGIIQTAPVTEITGDDWDRIMKVNLKGVFICCKAALPAMMAQRSGKIINIASVAGKRGGGLLGNSSYSASKGGVIAFTKSLAREAGQYGINVNAITPAFTDTDMTRSIDPEKKAFIIKMVPLGRVGQPEDIAGAVVFLASSQSDYMTGEMMDVDGGLMCD
ncbi:MAG: SDR family NAD(P)-dependent oxidoreductase [Negativicutes bacterium]